MLFLPRFLLFLEDDWLFLRVFPMIMIMMMIIPNPDKNDVVSFSLLRCLEFVSLFGEIGEARCYVIWLCSFVEIEWHHKTSYDQLYAKFRRRWTDATTDHHRSQFTIHTDFPDAFVVSLRWTMAVLHTFTL